MTWAEALAAADLTAEEAAHQASLDEARIQGAIAADPATADFSDPALAKHLRPVPQPDVRRIRAELAMTQQAFARALGVPVATIRDWEQGRRKPSGPALTLLRLVHAEPRTMADLLQRVAHPIEAPP